jgi:PilX N-terminal
MNHSKTRLPFVLRNSQRGAAALAVSLILLFGMTVIAFFANRGMIFEQRTSANQYRATKAFEVAEAGLEWAVARVNDEAFAAAAPSCNTSTLTTTTLTQRYLARDANGQFVPGAVGVRRLMACSVSSAGAVSCDCPVPVLVPPGTGPALGAVADARFLVEFTDGPDTSSIRITSRGCTNAGGFCDVGSTATADGAAVVTALYKMKPVLGSAPGAGLVAGAAASTTGNLTVINKDPKSNGITINTGAIVDASGSTSVVTLDGTPPRASILDNDFALRNLANADANGELFFRSFFNEGFTDYKNSQKTWIITAGSCAAYSGHCTQCTGNAGSCGQAVSDAWKNNNVERFWSDVSIDFTNNNYPSGQSTHGSPSRPLSVAAADPAVIGFNGNATAYGLFFAATVTADNNYDSFGNGSATIYGSIVSRGNFIKGNGTMRVIYDANLFNPENQGFLLVRVPGSWRDSLNEL